MHTAVRRFIKTGIAFLAVGLALGLAMLVQRELLGRWPHPYLVSAHTHALFSGFVMFLILGVALWLFPRPERGDRRYRPELVDRAYWILLTGTGLRVSTEIARAAWQAGWLAWLVLVGGTLQVLGFGLYFWTMWSRIRPVGSHLRESQGERF
ncbi:MAG: cbb3-type cytochrome c oxidase subunit I [Gemmatimonadetes bacterium]|nr:cbb3-type cytochrome c oxidase subunit I [Gemmatimonadota bacterium]